MPEPTMMASKVFCCLAFRFRFMNERLEFQDLKIHQNPEIEFFKRPGIFLCINFQNPLMRINPDIFLPNFVHSFPINDAQRQKYPFRTDYWKRSYYYWSGL